MKTPLTSPHLALWNTHESYQSWLAGVLRTPEGQLLMRVLEELSHPDIVDEDLDRIAPGANLIESIAFRHLLCSGQKMTLTNIRTLAHLDTDKVEELPSAWSYEMEEDTK